MNMKKNLLALFICASTLIVNAQVQMPQPSPTQTLTQNFGMGKIELTYSRPSLKGRTIFQESSELVPLGKMWRTGANLATRLHFSDMVTIGGKEIDTGSYALYTIPAKNEWTIIINRGFNNAGTEGYKESDDVVRFTVPPHTMDMHPVETFTMNFGDIKPESCNLYLMWANTTVTIPITTKVKDKLRAQIEEALQGDKKPYGQAANFYYEWDKNYAKALENTNEAIKENPNAFWMYLLKAKIEKANGDAAAAKVSAQKCKELAQKENNDDYVKQADKLITSL